MRRCFGRFMRMARQIGSSFPRSSTHLRRSTSVPHARATTAPLSYCQAMTVNRASLARHSARWLDQARHRQPWMVLWAHCPRPCSSRRQQWRPVRNQRLASVPPCAKSKIFAPTPSRLLLCKLKPRSKSNFSRCSPSLFTPRTWWRPRTCRASLHQRRLTSRTKSFHRLHLKLPLYVWPLCAPPQSLLRVTGKRLQPERRHPPPRSGRSRRDHLPLLRQMLLPSQATRKQRRHPLVPKGFALPPAGILS
mmetsp:Transcript_2967/g.9087  ORF Transcript_2967/g.9087 Transcript_2967/m.9087 type:complete len:249 (-) Transcript_2967:971-1717(-)